MIATDVLISTPGFRGLPEYLQNRIATQAFSRINPKTSFIVFDPGAEREEYEDEGQSLRIPCAELTEKVYAILDDYGSPEALSENLGRPVSTCYTITFLLAEEY